jgi:hypothetical protein
MCPTHKNYRRKLTEQPVSTRKGWDKDEWAAKAKAKDEENVERAKQAESALKQGESVVSVLFLRTGRW